MSLPPGPPAIPLLGVFGNALRFVNDALLQLRELHEHYGPVVSLTAGSPRYLFAFSPEANHALFSQPDLFHTLSNEQWPVRYPPDSAAWRLVEGGLLQMNGPRHKQQRRLILPAFHKQRVVAYRDGIVALTQAMLDGWREGEVHDLLAAARALTLSTAVQTFLGLPAGPEAQQMRQLVEQWIDYSFSIGAMLLPLRLPGTPFTRSLAVAEAVEQQLLGLIARRRAEGATGKDALSMLLQAQDEDGNRLTDLELVGQTMTLFVAGHITTASALTWTLLLLATHPASYLALMDELDEVLGGAPPEVAQLAELPLLEGTIKESLRLCPPLYWSARVTTAPTTLGGYDIPAGSQVNWSAAITHRLPALYPEPHRFKPERWQTISPSSYEYIPFGGGARRCIGAEFALLELRLVLAMLLQRFRPALPAQAHVARERRGAGLLFLTPKGPLPFTLLAPRALTPATTLTGSATALFEGPQG